MMELEDNSKRELVKVCQEVVDELAKINDVPSIPVILVDRVDDIDNLGAVFRKDQFRIEITLNIDTLAIVHEFTHYLIKLVEIADDIEEHLTQWVVLGYQTELQTLTKPKRIKTKLIEFQKRLDELNNDK